MTHAETLKEIRRLLHETVSALSEFRKEDLTGPLIKSANEITLIIKDMEGKPIDLFDLSGGEQCGARE